MSAPTLISTPIAIEVTKLNKRYRQKHVLHDVSFAVEKGQIFGFLGPNGSGKSTTIKILCGLVTPSSGGGSILGMDISQSMNTICRSIGYMSQQFGLYPDLTVMQNLRFYGGLYGLSGKAFAERLEAVVELTKIGPYLHFKSQHLSGGWKQRLALGCAIIHEPQVIFLDEPTAGIDPVARRDLWDLLFDLSSQGVTMFVTTHYMDEAERCHKVAYIYEGRLIAYGTNNDLRNLEAVTPTHARRLRVNCTPVMQAYRFCGNVDAILDVTVFGIDLHMVVANTMTDSQLSDLLNEQGFTVSIIEEIEPSLEDVFVALTQQAIRQQWDSRVS